ncbi:metal ABC transporter substrate-binding protein [Gallibacterium salpingitidis]|uniref:Iron-binding protein n=2 Tax=Gallibacterium salpingitidis TaxID=505341 RepID=A0A1A7NVZ5_9PAST|nr:metal ABC transporter substrate-binding protein [Gallibacterium salpingitidis]OBW93174.1 iron-binding protein [Gallibacterium salpingitidis]WKS98542.1 metal ABC transporter substrate-binding protein [Gallibacterium salpingitidis]
MLKKYLIFLCLLSMSALSLAKPFKVITTFTIIQDIAQNVAGDSAIVESITKPGAEIHNYQPTPKDIIKTQDADLILWNGLHLEQWFERFFKTLPKEVPSVVVSAGVEPISIYEGPYKGIPNPHAWMSPKNVMIYVENIRQALVKYDPANAENYNRNAEIYQEKLRVLDNNIREKLAHIPEKQRWLVTSEGAFSYLAKEYGFSELYLWPINAEQQGSPQQIRKVIEQVKLHHIPVVFSESTISDKPAKQVAKETGAKYGGVLYVDSLSTKTGPVPTFLDLLSTTTNTVIKGFSRE